MIKSSRVKFQQSQCTQGKHQIHRLQGRHQNGELSRSTFTLKKSLQKALFSAIYELFSDRASRPLPGSDCRTVLAHPECLALQRAENRLKRQMHVGFLHNTHRLDWQLCYQELALPKKTIFLYQSINMLLPGYFRVNFSRLNLPATLDPDSILERTSFFDSPV